MLGRDSMAKYIVARSTRKQIIHTNQSELMSWTDQHNESHMNCEVRFWHQIRAWESHYYRDLIW